MNGRLVSFWDGLFSGSMLVSGRVIRVSELVAPLPSWLFKPHLWWCFAGVFYLVSPLAGRSDLHVSHRLGICKKQLRLLQRMTTQPTSSWRWRGVANVVLVAKSKGNKESKMKDLALWPWAMKSWKSCKLAWAHLIPISGSLQWRRLSTLPKMTKALYSAEHIHLEENATCSPIGLGYLTKQFKLFIPSWSSRTSKGTT